MLSFRHRHAVLCLASLVATGCVGAIGGDAQVGDEPDLTPEELALDELSEIVDIEANRFDGDDEAPVPPDEDQLWDDLAMDMEALDAAEASAEEGSETVVLPVVMSPDRTRTLRRPHSNPDRRIAVAIYSSRKLLNSHGSRVAESMVARWLARTFAALNYGYTIVYNLPAQAPPSERGVCGGTAAYRWWSRRGRDLPVVVKDSNLLLTNAHSGGCGGLGGRFAVSGVNPLSRPRSYTRTGTGVWFFRMRGAIHEVGHNLGLGHEHGFGFVNRDGMYRRSPMFTRTGIENGCGNDIVARPRDSEWLYDTRFSPCSQRRIRVK